VRVKRVVRLHMELRTGWQRSIPGWLKKPHQEMVSIALTQFSATLSTAQKSTVGAQNRRYQERIHDFKNALTRAAFARAMKVK